MRLFDHILDFLFPPTPEGAALRALSPAQFFAEAPRALKPAFPFVSSLFSYKDPLVKELVLSIKNKKDRHAFECAGYALYNELLGKYESALLVPIPISKKRRKERGYNQCELLVDAILKHDGAHKFEKNFNLLARPRDHGEQKMKNREERLSSTTDLFTVNKIETTKPIIIIDDVCTTGSTLKEAHDALLRAGYPAVFCLTLAH